MALAAIWVSAIGNLTTGIGAGLGGWAALRGVNAWRIESLGRRKAELAEEVLAQFYRAKDALIWARLPADGDGAERQVGSAAPARGATAMAAPVERLNQASQVFSELQASRYRFMAYFGEDAARPFEDLRRVHNEVVEAASRLIRGQGQTLSDQDAADHAQWRTTIGWGSQEQDQLAGRLEHAVRAIERICRPLIEEPKPGRLSLARRPGGGGAQSQT
ncbi:MAG TPA: hypothetical protein VG227_03025 [Caulobacteraceae bacterium]|jgi:hypothetical protein|nr:hypothetical protein [Caulobacteraceae bacterium]